MATENDDLVYRYYKEIANFKPLSREDEATLIKSAQYGDVDA